METFTNTFSGGMSADVDKHLQKPTTYRYAKNGRLMYNREQNKNVSLEESVKNGASFVFSNIIGNTLVAQFCEGYELIGDISTTKGQLVFLTDGFQSEIGIATVENPADVPGSVKYYTLYNDRNDPNTFNSPFARHVAGSTGGDRLMFSKEYPIHGYAVYENEYTERVYFTDGKNQKRTFNLNDFYSDKAATVPYHPKNLSCFTPIATYPKWMSAHAMDEQPDCVMPTLKFRRRIRGKLKSGVYQIAVRYRSKAGAVSPFSALTRRVFVTNHALDGSNGLQSLLFRSNHHNRVMADKNEVATQEGLRFEIFGIDTRWDELEVAYVYHITDTEMKEAYIFQRLKLDNISSRTVDLVSHSAPAGEILIPLTAADLTQIYQTVISVESTIEYQNQNYDFNLRLLPDIKFDLGSATIQPEYKYFREDDTLEPSFTFVNNGVTKRGDGDPLTNTATITTFISKSQFTGQEDIYAVEVDYLNYKGQQIESNFKGYFRGETYPVGLLPVDRKGNPLQVDIISEYTFPQQYDNYPDNTLTRKNIDGKYDLRAMGMRISGIRIRKDQLFDENGRLNLSGFMIVRGQRVGNIKCQGYMFPTLMSPNCKTDTKNDGYVKPMGFPQNQFIINYQSFEKGDTHAYYNGLSPCKIKTGDIVIFGGDADPAFPAFSCPYIFTFHSPDILFEETVRDLERTDQFHHVGQVHRAYTKGAKEMQGNNFHFYTKSYRTTLLRDTNAARDNQYIQNGRPSIGSKTRIKSMFRHTLKEKALYEKFDSDYFGYDYSVVTDNVSANGTNGNGSNCVWMGYQQPGSLVVRCLDWESIDLAEDNIGSGENGCSYRMVNWLESPRTSQNDQTNRWISTGHYQPLTMDVLDRAKKEYDVDGNIIAYRFDDVEVWGGDCYVNIFDFARLYPYSDGCGKICTRYYDTACSHLMPVESKYNLALRFGRKVSANATNPVETSCEGAELQFSNGVMMRQPEDWNYNRALLLEESTQFYFSRLNDVRLTQNRPVGLMWSPVKAYGERYDSYRQKLPLNYADLSGEYGPVTKVVKHFDYVYAIQQKAFGVVLLNQREFVPTDAGEITVQSGNVFSGIKYISTQYGTRYKLSIWEAENRFGFIDTRKGEMVGFSQAGRNLIGEDNNLDDLISRVTIYYPENPQPLIVKNIISGFDEENKEVLVTFRYDVPGQKDKWDRQMRSFTLSYNYAQSAFVSELSVLPDAYMNIGRYLLSFKKNKGVFLHNYGRYGYWYGMYYPTTLRFIVNPHYNVRKVFDNAYISISELSKSRLTRLWHKTFDIEHTLNYVGVESGQIKVLDDRFNYYQGLLAYPIHEDNGWDEEKPRLRGQILEVELTIENGFQSIDGQNRPVRIRAFDTKYRVIFPVQY